MTFCKNYHFHSLTTALMFRFRMRLTIALAALCSWCLMFLMFLMLSHANAACRTWRHEDSLRIVRNHAIWDWIILNFFHLLVRLCYSRRFQGLFSFQIPYLSILKYLKGFAAHVQFTCGFPFASTQLIGVNETGPFGRNAVKSIKSIKSIDHDRLW